MQCPSCGVESVEQAVFCHRCGQRLEPGDAGTSSPVVSQNVVAEPAEEEIWRGGYSSKAMAGLWIVCGLISLVALLIGVFWARTTVWWLTVLAVAVLPWCYYLSLLCYRRLSVHYVLTSRRFIHESGLVRRVNNRIELLDVDDITFEQGPLDRLTGVGTIRIASHDRTDPMLVLPGVEDVKQVAATLDNARLVERRRRGLHIEQI
ncbi:MAG: PH domain-containing protein [Thermoguttaceae bacterium]